MSKKILIIDDSALMRRIFCDIISADNRFEVADIAKDGVEGIAYLTANSYDVVILDINMPRMNGIEVLQEIKRQGIKANVIVASTYTKDGEATLKCLELGAIDFIQKPLITRDTKSEAFINLFISLVEAAASIESVNKKQPREAVKLPAKKENIVSEIKEAPPAKASDAGAVKGLDKKNGKKPLGKGCLGKKIIAICSSTGGPQALKNVIPLIPKNIDAPVLVVQHMPSGFTKSLADRLNDISNITVCEAEEGQVLKKNCVYISRGGNHFKIIEDKGVCKVTYTDEAPREGVKPCANYMYESLIDTSYDDITCVVLTGMGKDGLDGIKHLVEAGEDKKVFVIAQNKESCTVYGMPRAVDLAGLTNKSVDISQVANEIIMNVGVK